MDIESIPLVSLACLTPDQKNKLSAGGITLVKDLILANPSDLARTLRFELDEVDAIILKVSNEVAPPVKTLSDTLDQWGKFTTGDALLDQALGGGIRTGMLWEFCGESSAGKTQLAMQLALTVQLPPSLLGLDGNACYITTVGRLHTERMSQILRENELFQDTLVNLDRVHTLQILSADGLISLLKNTVPELIEQLKSLSPSKKLKLLVLDSITPLVRSDGKMNTRKLAQRSKLMTQIAAGLRAIAFRYQVAVVILNEVTDTFDQPLPSHDGPKEELYQYQIQFISRANTLPGEDTKEACLGLVWANQINVRTMMTRTSRRIQIPIAEDVRAAKRRKTKIGTTYEGIHDDLANTTLLRRMSIVFNPVVTPRSVDYIIHSSGVLGIALVESNTQEFKNDSPNGSGAIHMQLVSRPSRDEEEEELWKAVDGLDGADDSLFVEPEQEDIVGQQIPDTTLLAEEQVPNQKPEDPGNDSAEEELWANMPDLSQYIPQDEPPNLLTS